MDHQIIWIYTVQYIKAETATAGADAKVYEYTYNQSLGVYLTQKPGIGFNRDRFGFYGEIFLKHTVEWQICKNRDAPTSRELFTSEKKLNVL